MAPLRLYRYAGAPNFGDDLNALLWPRMLGDLVDVGRPLPVGSARAGDPLDDELFLGIGTLVNHRLPAARRLVVLGAGVGYGAPPDLTLAWDVRAVRGPDTATALGHGSDVVATDAAALLGPAGLLPARRGGTGAVFAPHHRWSRGIPWPTVCRAAGVGLVDPRHPIDSVLARLARADIVLTGALHVAIVADALGIPWVAVGLEAGFPHGKWADWCGSLRLEHRPLLGPGLRAGEGRRALVGNPGALPRLVTFLRRASVDAERWSQLSDRRLLDARTEQLVTAVDRLRSEP